MVIQVRRKYLPSSSGGHENKNRNCRSPWATRNSVVLARIHTEIVNLWGVVRRSAFRAAFPFVLFPFRQLSGSIFTRSDTSPSHAFVPCPEVASRLDSKCVITLRIFFLLRNLKIVLWYFFFCILWLVVRCFEWLELFFDFVSRSRFRVCKLFFHILWQLVSAYFD